MVEVPERVVLPETTAYVYVSAEDTVLYHEEARVERNRSSARLHQLRLAQGVEQDRLEESEYETSISR